MKNPYNTLGAIAMQGVRQADLRVGESCALIGLGLLGQLTGLILRASGIRVVGLDIDSAAVDVANGRAAHLAMQRTAPGVEEAIDEFTQGLGVDAVIITAATHSLDPINFAGRIARKKGRVVIVGNVPAGFDREPHYYRKELEVRMSCSYGPGRYDLEYEEKGCDYPPAYVRWTENRNMDAFQHLVHAGQLDLDYLTTHEFPIEQAPDAYDLILERREPYFGILLKYDADRPVSREAIGVREIRSTGEVGVAFIGAGSYAQGNLLPNLPADDPGFVRRGVMTASGTTAKRVAERFGFEFCTSREADILAADNISTVFVATRHDTHADYVVKALEAGKHVFVEKPLALTVAELDRIRSAYELRANDDRSTMLMVGFNRRFAPMTEMLVEHVGRGPMAMVYRVNAGAIPSDSWYHDPDMGGGRILGEACHFIDYLVHLNGSLPVRVFTTSLADPHGHNDTVCINLGFANGSVGSVCYYANGCKSLGKEYVEVHRGGMTGVLTDFKELTIYGGRKTVRKRRLNQDKGQRPMVQRVLKAVKTGGPAPIPFSDLHAVTLATLKAVESLRTNEALAVDID